MAHTAEDTRLMKTDLDQLKAFIKSDLLSAVVKREAEAAVHRVENILSHEEKEEAAGPGIRRGSGSSIDLYYESGTGLHPLGRVSSDQPVSSLKSVLLNKSLSFVNCERARVERTGAVLSLLSEATISQSGLVTGDVLIPEDTTAMVVEETPSGELNEAGVHSAGQADERVMFYRLVIKSGCFPKSAFEAVVVAAHYYLLSYTDLVCIAEVPSNVPGFAPSVRELPQQQFLPPKWNSGKNSVTLTYRSKQKLKNTFKCEFYLDLDKMSIAFGNKDNATGINTGISNSIEVILVDYINAESPAFKSVTKTIKDFQLIYENEDDLFESFSTLLKDYDYLYEKSDNYSMMKRSPNLMDAHLPGISGSIYGKNSGSASPIYDENSVVKMGNKSLASLNTLSPPKSAASDSSSGGHNYYQRKSPNASLAPVTPLHPLPIASTDWVDGAKESHQDVSWNSASPTKHHNRALVGDDDLFSHHHHGMTPLQPLSSGGGMLMGPDHPIFSSDGQRGTEAFLPGGVRGARYDPLMPPVSTGTGLDAGMLGGDGMTRPPKGRGPHKLQPGEPNPDHLKPPSWNQGPGFI